MNFESPNEDADSDNSDCHSFESSGKESQNTDTTASPTSSRGKKGEGRCIAEKVLIFLMNALVY
jgi:hypothetical protein